jgi:CrcB protein
VTTPRRLTGIALGGVAGAAVRWAVLTSTNAGAFPWPVLAVNVAGSLLLGAFLAESELRPVRHRWFHDLGGIGFCGGLTTFSTFTVESAALVRDGEPVTAAVYVVLSVALAVAGVVGGAAMLRRTRAAAAPVEEAP